MLEIYSLPTAQSYLYNGCIFRARTDQKTLSPTAINIDNVVLYEASGTIESGLLGIVYKAQISVSTLADDPEKGYIVIGGKAYTITSSKLMKNPLFKDFWQLEVKSAKLL